ncbi:MAG: phosphoribosylanthranilate isomerase [Anaerolineaceae bacterium]|nr:phosphoribosylanthranilate isomerase [Anaerolineaceae bacterium]
MTRVKICGVTTLDDALAAAEYGAHLLGLNFYRQSPRFIHPDNARILCDELRAMLGDACPTLVGVFVNATGSDIAYVVGHARLDFAQLSGDESDAVLVELRGRAYKAIRPPNMTLALEDVKYYRSVFPSDERIPSLLLDAYHPNLYGGTGEQASVEVALAVKELVPRLMLAGGLTPENVGGRVAQIQPWGVDVASGVESTPGVKDYDKMRIFADAARNAS